jgi:surfeit locus 1 family protein
MRIGQFDFRPGLWPTLAVFALLPILIGMGLWQLDRADQKRQLQSLLEQRSQDLPVRIDKLVDAGADMQFRQVTVSGRFDPHRQLFLDNRVYRTQAGYDVLTPLQIEGSGVWVLINRGWVPVGASREELPQIPAVPEGRVTLVGVAKVPPKEVFTLGGKDAEKDPLRPVIEYIDLQRIAQRNKFELQPFVILLNADQPYGLVREWTLFSMGPERHLGYAFQWFSLAVALCILYGVANTRRVKA